MSYYLIDFTLKSNDYNFDNFTIGRKIKLDQDNYKYYIYYQNDVSDDPKEIYIRLPILRLIYNLNNHKFNQLNIPIYPNWELTNKFIEFIKKLESDIEGCFSNKKINKEFISIITKKNSINFIKTNINENVKLSSNLKDKDITLSDFKITGQIDIVIKLGYIWSKGPKMGLSSQIYQIKYLACPDQLNINFIDSDIPNKIISNITQIKVNSNKLLLNSPNTPQIEINSPNTSQIEINSDKLLINSSTNDLPIKCIRLTHEDLKKAIKRLKSINDK
jgi:hypothetical protein